MGTVPQKWQVPSHINNRHSTVPYNEWARYRLNGRYRPKKIMGTVPLKWQVPSRKNDGDGTTGPIPEKYWAGCRKKLQVPSHVNNGHGTAKIAGLVPHK